MYHPGSDPRLSVLKILGPTRDYGMKVVGITLLMSRLVRYNVSMKVKMCHPGVHIVYFTKVWYSLDTIVANPHL